MPSSRQNKSRKKDLPIQMGLDFIQENQYIIAPFKGDIAVETELLERLEEKIGSLLSRYAELQEKNQALQDENSRLQSEREAFKGRIDSVLSKLEGV